MRGNWPEWLGRLWIPPALPVEDKRGNWPKWLGRLWSSRAPVEKPRHAFEQAALQIYERMPAVLNAALADPRLSTWLDRDDDPAGPVPHPEEATLAALAQVYSLYDHKGTVSSSRPVWSVAAAIGQRNPVSGSSVRELCKCFQSMLDKLTDKRLVSTPTGPMPKGGPANYRALAAAGIHPLKRERGSTSVSEQRREQNAEGRTVFAKYRDELSPDAMSVGLDKPNRLFAYEHSDGQLYREGSWPPEILTMAALSHFIRNVNAHTDPENELHTPESLSESHQKSLALDLLAYTCWVSLKVLANHRKVNDFKHASAFVDLPETRQRLERADVAWRVAAVGGVGLSVALAALGWPTSQPQPAEAGLAPAQALAETQPSPADAAVAAADPPAVLDAALPAEPDAAAPPERCGVAKQFRWNRAWAIRQGAQALDLAEVVQQVRAPQTKPIWLHGALSIGKTEHAKALCRALDATEGVSALYYDATDGLAEAWPLPVQADEVQVLILDEVYALSPAVRRSLPARVRRLLRSGRRPVPQRRVIVVGHRANRAGRLDDWTTYTVPLLSRAELESFLTAQGDPHGAGAPTSIWDQALALDLIAPTGPDAPVPSFGTFGGALGLDRGLKAIGEASARAQVESVWTQWLYRHDRQEHLRPHEAHAVFGELYAKALTSRRAQVGPLTCTRVVSSLASDFDTRRARQWCELMLSVEGAFSQTPEVGLVPRSPGLRHLLLAQGLEGVEPTPEAACRAVPVEDRPGVDRLLKPWVACPWRSEARAVANAPAPPPSAPPADAPYTGLHTPASVWLNVADSFAYPATVRLIRSAVSAETPDVHLGTAAMVGLEVLGVVTGNGVTLLVPLALSAVTDRSLAVQPKDAVSPASKSGSAGQSDPWWWPW